MPSSYHLESDNFDLFLNETRFFPVVDFHLIRKDLPSASPIFGKLTLPDGEEEQGYNPAMRGARVETFFALMRRLAPQYALEFLEAMQLLPSDKDHEDLLGPTANFNGGWLRLTGTSQFGVYNYHAHFETAQPEASNHYGTLVIPPEFRPTLAAAAQAEVTADRSTMTVANEQRMISNFLGRIHLLDRFQVAKFLGVQIR